MSPGESNAGGSVGEVAIVGIRPTVKTVCTGVEMFRKLLISEVKLVTLYVKALRGTKRDDVERGQVLAASNTITPVHTNFEAEVYVRPRKKAGGTLPSSAATGIPYFLHHGCDRLGGLT
ncbi:MAG: hypothetical protein U1F42_00345 [Candidatus Competibacteraceae bacterium]